MMDFLNPQRFADGGDGGTGSAGGAGAGASTTAGESAEAEGRVASGKGRKGNPLEQVSYGIQGTAQVAQAQETQAEGVTGVGEQEPGKSPAQDETFEELIKGKFKKDYDARVQQIVKDRLKSSKGAEDKLNALAPALTALMRQHGLEAKDGEFDAKALSNAILSDDSLYEQEAMERGIPADVVKQIHALEAENQEHVRKEAEAAEETQMRRHFSNLVQQAEEIKGVYPGFDLTAEMKNPDFAKLTMPGVGVPLRTAYEVVHKDEILAGGMQYTAQRVAQKMAGAMAAQARRPSEAGSGAGAPALSKQDPSKLTKADFLEIARRVGNGEKIRF